MGLSEHEQRILDELESQLRTQDPGLARRASKLERATGSPQLVRAGVLFAVGFALLLTLAWNPIPAVVGVVLMFIALVRGGRSLAALAREQAARARQQQASSDNNG